MGLSLEHIEIFIYCIRKIMVVDIAGYSEKGTSLKYLRMASPPK